MLRNLLLALLLLSSTARAAVVVLVHGFEPQHEAPLWNKEIARLEALEHEVHFLTWSKRLALEQNTQQLAQRFHELRKKHPEEFITVVAFSAGGIMALKAQELYQQEAADERLHLHTVASPLYGYQAPRIAPLVALMIGKSALAIGQGVFSAEEASEIRACQHWINTDCRKDKHACASFDQLPMTGNLPLDELPCQAAPTTALELGHEELVSHVLAELFPGQI